MPQPAQSVTGHPVPSPQAEGHQGWLYFLYIIMSSGFSPRVYLEVKEWSEDCPFYPHLLQDLSHSMSQRSREGTPFLQGRGVRHGNIGSLNCWHELHARAEALCSWKLISLTRSHQPRAG